jgi:hypothetical protein
MTKTKNHLRISCVSFVSAAAISSGVFACSSATNPGQNVTDGGGDESSVGADGGGGGDAGVGGRGDGGDGDGGANVTRSEILVTQTHIGANVSYSVSAGFYAPTPPGTGTTTATSTTLGDCSALVLPISTDDAGVPTGVSGLNAGTLTLVGSGTPASTTLLYGPEGSTGLSNYARQTGNTAIFAGGDTFTLSGAGGSDLPSFGPQMLITPSEIVLTAPACSGGSCPDLDRTTDLSFTWTGGGAGNVLVSFETLATAQAVFLQCRFPAVTGSGTVPAALLGKLDKAGDPGVTGFVAISPSNSVDFLVGTLPAKLTAQLADFEAPITVSN